ncbi:hypothetical protein [Burkholderia gladioli]|uniref:hypothetical protein n=1 Tax=Burkholderia gladioli TaxID=28095 RepID=UPI00163F702E|nr:hypothetical protein [Burkholderia gladioli]
MLAHDQARRKTMRRRRVRDGLGRNPHATTSIEQRRETFRRNLYLLQADIPREDYCRDAQRLHAKTLYRQIEERVAIPSENSGFLTPFTRTPRTGSGIDLDCLPPSS